MKINVALPEFFFHSVTGEEKTNKELFAIERRSLLPKLDNLRLSRIHAYQ